MNEEQTRLTLWAAKAAVNAVYEKNKRCGHIASIVAGVLFFWLVFIIVVIRIIVFNIYKYVCVCRWVGG